MWFYHLVWPRSWSVTTLPFTFTPPRAFPELLFQRLLRLLELAREVVVRGEREAADA